MIDADASTNTFLNTLRKSKNQSKTFQTFDGSAGVSSGDTSQTGVAVLTSESRIYEMLPNAASKHQHVTADSLSRSMCL